ncbi:MAG TPA: ABC transporter permease [Vicinamibacterales bacterium]|nr:ABC transporter permease [Vicinamibacterales bacterium]
MAGVRRFLLRLLATLRPDARYAIRSLVRDRGFTIATVLTLAIGIGAATAIYSVVDTILFRPLPFPGGDRLVRLVEWGPHFRAGGSPLERGITYLEHQTWRERSATIEEAAAIITMSQRMVKTPDGAAGLWGAMVSGNTFSLLQARPQLGRTLQPADEGNAAVVVLSYDTWQRHFQSDRSIVGRALEFRVGALLAARPPMYLTVVGVLAPDFRFPMETLDFVMPIALDPSRPSPGVTTIARLAPGLSLDAATQEANSLGAAMRKPWPPDRLPPAGPRFEYHRVKERLTAPVRPAMRVILAAVVVLLLIVCANAANLLLARGTSRRREIAVRIAIGASQAQVFRQVLLECAVLAAAGGALGALLGASGVVLVRELATVEAPGIFRLMFGANILPRANEVVVDWRLFGIAFGIATVAAFTFGVLPGLQLARANHLRSMGSRGGGSSRGESRLRTALTLAQIVMATVLLTGAGLLAHSFINLWAFNKGYDPANVLAANLLFPDTYSTARKGEVIEALLTRFRANPGVSAAGFARHGLLIGEVLHIGKIVPPGRTLADVDPGGVRTRSVSNGFLTAMGVPFIHGRDLSPADSAGAPGAIVINRSAARHYFGDANPVGQSMLWVVGKTQSNMTVVGVVEDVRQEEATDPLAPEMFFDYRQYLAVHDIDNPARQNEGAIGFLSFALRTAGDPAALIPAVRETIRAIDPNIGVDAIAPMERLEAGARAKQRFYAVMLSTFAGVSALLAVIGVFGVLSYTVVQRTREIGVRVALGARGRQVVALIMRQGLAITAVGVLVGLIIAGAVARSLESMLFGISPLDPTTFAAVATGFAIVAALASYFPARIATTIDPAITLRDE